MNAAQAAPPAGGGNTATGANSPAPTLLHLFGDSIDSNIDLLCGAVMQKSPVLDITNSVANVAQQAELIAMVTAHNNPTIGGVPDLSQLELPEAQDIISSMQLSRLQKYAFWAAEQREKSDEKLIKIQNNCGGAAAFTTTLSMCQAQGISDLTPTMWSLISAAEGQRDDILQSAFVEELVAEGIKSNIVLAKGLADLIITGDWATNSPGEVVGGSIANLFKVFPNQQTVRSANQLRTLVMDGRAKINASASELNSLIAEKLHLPDPENTRRFILVGKLLMKLIQGPDGDLFKYLDAHYKAFLANEEDFSSQGSQSPEEAQLRGVYQLMILNSAMYNWTAATRGGQTPPVLNPTWMFDQLALLRPWQPMINRKLREGLSLELCANSVCTCSMPSHHGVPVEAISEDNCKLGANIVPTSNINNVTSHKSRKKRKSSTRRRQPSASSGFRRKLTASE
jgi:hypothetical protein